MIKYKVQKSANAQKKMSSGGKGDAPMYMYGGKTYKENEAASGMMIKEIIKGDKSGKQAEAARKALNELDK
jgi:hypothetical protein